MRAHRTTTRRFLAPAALAGALVLASCGDDASSSPTTAPTSDPATTLPSSTVPPTTEAPPPTGELPGTPEELGPPAGAVLGVVAVAHDDHLNVRAAPGGDQPIVTTLDPLADDVVAVGNTRSLPGSWWYEVRTPGGQGWVRSSFVAFLGATRDVTTEVADDLGGLPGAETMVEIGEVVAATRASEEPPSTITRPAVPTVDDVGTVTMDVTGLGDDAQYGERIVVVATPTPSGEGFVVESVQAQALCGRGVTSTGLCV